MNEITTISLFKKYQLENNKVIWLENKDRIPVAALYLDKVNLDNFVICNCTTVNEKYYLVADGIAIFFSYYRTVK